jgi:hypothetical protein
MFTSMKRLSAIFLSELKARRYRNKIRKALALNLRGEMRNDGLKLEKVTHRLEIEWCAREIHPWDRVRNLSADENERLFMEQSLADTEAAIHRLFEMLPHVDLIALRVSEPGSKRMLLAGTVSRTGVEESGRLSVGMRLRLSGVTFRLSGFGFEALAAVEAGDAPDRDVLHLA